jgi:tetratricopeptide (TPR) repeat protein
MAFVKKHILWTLFLLIFAKNTSKAQILKDPQICATITEGLNHAYNYNFEKAKASYALVQQKYPNSPAYSTLMHMLYFMQYLPLKDNPKAKAQYLVHLNKSITLAEKYIEKNENEPEAIFFMLSSLGSLASWQADNGDMMKAVNTARKVYPYMKKGLKLNSKLADFLYTSGLYNYYVEQYPIDHPIVKPFMVFFSDGDKKTGLAQLEQCGQKALFSHIEASYYLTYILIKHENKYDKALKVVQALANKYPNNTLYASRVAECQLAMGIYDDATTATTQKLMEQSGNVFPAIGNVFAGIIQEKAKKADAAASTYYQKAISYPTDVRFTQDYQALAHLGLGRIAIRQKKYTEAKSHLHKAQSLAEYVSVDAEAERLLKNLPR